MRSGVLCEAQKKRQRKSLKQWKRASQGLLSMKHRSSDKNSQMMALGQVLPFVQLPASVAKGGNRTFAAQGREHEIGAVLVPSIHLRYQQLGLEVRATSKKAFLLICGTWTLGGAHRMP